MGETEEGNDEFHRQSVGWAKAFPLLSLYFETAEKEDDKMVNRWQADANGFLIFTGLFSASVAVLLAVTVQDLRPNSQDTSAFYLRNIYQALADPNVTRPSIPFPVAEPPPFSPPRSAVWVNSLWFLSLIMSLSCALLETSVQQWARQYLPRIRKRQYSSYNPSKRAVMRAFYANGVEKMYAPQVVERLPALLHLSLFLFFGGLAIFLFNINHEVFIPVIWWIGLFSMAYGVITLLPIIRLDSPYSTPLSTPAWFLYIRILYATFKILAFITYHFGGYRTWERCEDLRDRYQRWILRGVEKAAKDTALKPGSEINFLILDWTISTLYDDDSLKRFFEVITDIFNSKSMDHLPVGNEFPERLLKKFVNSLSGFLGRTWSSNLIKDSEKIRQFDKAMDTMNVIHHTGVSLIIHKILRRHWDTVPQTVEMGQALARWCTSSDQSVTPDAQLIIARILLTVQERNGSWVTLATQVFGPFGPPKYDFQDNVTSGMDSMLLAILIRLIRVIRLITHLDHLNLRFLGKLPKLDIHNASLTLQHEFCMLWNDIVQESSRGPSRVDVNILKSIHPLYIALHRGINLYAAPPAFTAATHSFDLSYLLCNIATHRPGSKPPPKPPGRQPDASSHPPTDGGNTASRQAGQVNNVVQPSSSSNPTTNRETSHYPDMTPLTNPAHSSSRPTDASPIAVVPAAPQDTSSTATLSHPLERSEQGSDMVAEPGASQILSTASAHEPTPTLVPITTSLPNTPSESYDAGIDSSHFALPSIGSSIRASRPTGSTSPPRPRARGLVNTRNICFANSILQLLVNSPPLWNMFRELGDLKGQRGAGVPEIDGGAKPLVDATLRFFKEFIVEEDSPSTQQQSQPATGGISRADEEKKDDNVVDSFEPTYMYDAMKEKRQLKPLLDGQQQDAEEFLCQYFNALDEELLTSISGRQFARGALDVEEREMSQSGQAEAGNRGPVWAESIESPLSRIFSGRFRSTVRVPNQPDTVTIEDWRSLQLDIQHDSVHTVEDALARISRPQPVHLDSSGINEASQQTLIEALPPVLVIHLKRFLYDPAVGGVVKIGKPIWFTPELEIPSDIMAPIAQKPASTQPGSYALYGVLYHLGVSSREGHYTVDVLHPNGNHGGEGWLHIDDKTVSALRREDIFGGHDSRQTDDRCPYLLFYRRTTSARTL